MMYKKNVGNSLGFENMKQRNAVYVDKSIGFETILPKMFHNSETMVPRKSVGNSTGFETEA